MIRLITCIRRLPSLSEEEFIRIWEDPKTAELYDRVVAALQPEKFARHRTLVVQSNQEMMKLRKSEKPFDAVVEWWYKGALQVQPRLESQEGQDATRALQDYQKSFVDFKRSPSFFTLA